MKKNKNFKIKISFCLLILFLTYLLVSKYLNIYLFCPFHKITGLYCPGCGITRMFLSILTGDFYQAFRYNSLVFISLPIMIFLYINNLLYPKKAIIKKIPSNIWYLTIAIFLIYGVLRNIPFFDFLAPTLLT